MDEDTNRDVIGNFGWGKILQSGSPVVIGTAQQSDEQMEAFDKFNDEHPSEVVNVKDGRVISPRLDKIVRNLPRTPAIYESQYLTDSVVRFDTTITPAGATTTLNLPNPIPQGKYGFLDEIHIAQLGGAGSTPSGFLSDTALSQLYAILTPDGSTFCASYKSGRTIVPGGVILMLTFNSLLGAQAYLVGVQYKVKTRVDIPLLSLSDISSGEDRISFDDGNEVGIPGMEHNELPGGPYDDAGWDGT